MLTRYFGAAALALQCAHAFRDASPFFMSSTSSSSSDLGNQNQRLQDAQVASAASIAAGAGAAIEDCEAHAYVFVSQPGVSGADFPPQSHLMKRLSVGESGDAEVRSAARVSNVVGAVDLEALRSAVEKRCKGQEEGAGDEWKSWRVDAETGHVPHFEQKTQAINVVFPAPPAEQEDRASALARSDSFLNDILAQLDSYTVFYATTPVSAGHYQETQHPDQPYEMDSPFPSGMHGDLKRDLSGYASSNDNNTGNLHSDVPLFEKYQFVNQGIFITGTVTLLLLVILSVGVRAIAGLEVSYMAFSKEMGPAAQKKQQQ